MPNTAAIVPAGSIGAAGADNGALALSPEPEQSPRSSSDLFRF